MKTEIMKLVGCMDSFSPIIRTRFFYVNGETEEVRDVTLELCSAIEAFNDVARKVRVTGTYSMIIPFEYKYGLADYSFGCGLSHYLQEREFDKIKEAYVNTGNPLSFPLVNCSISMYTPVDVKYILGCKGVFDQNITNKLTVRYSMEKVA